MGTDMYSFVQACRVGCTRSDCCKSRLQRCVVLILRTEGSLLRGDCSKGEAARRVSFPGHFTQPVNYWLSVTTLGCLVCAHLTYRL